MHHVSLALLLASPAVAAAQGPLADPLPDIPVSPVTARLADSVSTLEFPIDVADPGDGSGRLFVNGFDGRTHIVQNGAILPVPFADLRQAPPFSTSSSAMSSIAFHPDFVADEAAGIGGRIYVVMVEAPATGMTDFGCMTGTQQSVLYELRPMANDPNREDPARRREVLRIGECNVIHNLNDLAFGPDGYLYAAKGDDLSNQGGQDTTTINGNVLRIDVDGQSGNPLSANARYWIPADNPFVGDPSGLDEIYAYGFRNPWRMSFDFATGDFFVTDVGERDIEEVNRVDLAPDGSARNYGWNEMEGSFRFLGIGMGVTDDLTGLPPGFVGVDPIGQYDHTENFVSITGGILYRGNAYPALRGKFLFGEWIAGHLFTLDVNTGAIERLMIDPSGDTIHGQPPYTTGEPREGVIALRADAQGEPLILVTQRNLDPEGRLLRIAELPIGASYCGPAVPNSTGVPGVITAAGSSAALDGDVTLTARDLPLEFGYFLASQTQSTFQPPGSTGLLCLGGNIGRYAQPQQIIVGPTGTLELDLGAVPVNPPVAVTAGDTWNFQCWFRDQPATSNFTDGVSITFF